MPANPHPKPGQSLEAHELALLFPAADETDFQALLQSIKDNGQREDIVLLDGKVLDGWTRYSICQRLKVEPKFRPYDYTKDGKSPLQFVLDKNLNRRHLSVSSRSALAADLIPKFVAQQDKKREEEQAASRGSGAPIAPSRAGGSEPNEYDQGEGSSADESQEYQAPAPQPKAPRKRRGSTKAAETHHSPAVEAAAAAVGVSPASVEKAAALKNSDPQKFEEVKAGELSLNAATQETAAAKAKAAEYDDALSRIKTICGESLYQAVKEGVRLKTHKEVVEYAALSDDDMIKCRGLIQEGWPLKKAVKYKMQSLTQGHKISDLLTRAAAQGAMFCLFIGEWEIIVKKKENHEQ